MNEYKTSAEKEGKKGKYKIRPKLYCFYDFEWTYDNTKTI